MDGSAAGRTDVGRHLARRMRWRPVETALWAATLLVPLLAPSYLVLASQTAIAALFALSLDLILGYAGLVSLGHAAFFGVGAYTAGLLAKHGWGEPLSGLVVAGAAAASEPPIEPKPPTATTSRK